MAGSITKQFDFIINSATHTVSKKCDLKLPRSTSFNYFVAESIMPWHSDNTGIALRARWSIFFSVISCLFLDRSRRLRRRGAEVLALDATTDPQGPSMEDVMEGNPDDRPDRAAMRSEVRALMEACIDALPEAFRTVFMLRAVEEMSVEEVSAALGLPEATVRTRFFRARKLLRQTLSRDFDAALADAFSFDGQRCERIAAAVLARLARERGPCAAC